MITVFKHIKYAELYRKKYKFEGILFDDGRDQLEEFFPFFQSTDAFLKKDDFWSSSRQKQLITPHLSHPKRGSSVLEIKFYFVNK